MNDEDNDVGALIDKYTIYCSFCGKSQYEVKHMIAGHITFICDECVQLCVDRINEQEAKLALNQNL